MKGLLRGATRIHVLLYRVTGGRLGGRAGKAPILLLTTTGRDRAGSGPCRSAISMTAAPF